MPSKDETLVLRHYPTDATPGWVGGPSEGARKPSTAPPPWTPTVAVAFDWEADQTLCGAPARPRPKLRLLLCDPSLKGELTRDRRWRGALDQTTTFERPRAICDLLADNAAADSRALVAAREGRAARDGEVVEILSGDLALELDPAERLRSTVAAMLPFAPGSRPLALALHDGRTLLRGALAVSALEDADRAIWAAFARPEIEGVRLRAQIDKGLIARRAFRRAHVDGYVAAVLRLDDDATLPCLLRTKCTEGAALSPLLRGRAFVALTAASEGASTSARHVLLAFAQELDSNEDTSEQRATDE